MTNLSFDDYDPYAIYAELNRYSESADSDETKPVIIEKLNDKHFFILELSEDVVLLLAQLCHLYKEAKPKSLLAEKALQQLVDQADCVNLSPNKHNVYASIHVAPRNHQILKMVPFVALETEE